MKTFQQFVEGYREQWKRELKLKGQGIVNDKERYDKGTTPVKPIRSMDKKP